MATEWIDWNKQECFCKKQTFQENESSVVVGFYELSANAENAADSIQDWISVLNKV